MHSYHVPENHINRVSVSPGICRPFRILHVSQQKTILSHPEIRCRFIFLTLHPLFALPCVFCFTTFLQEITCQSLFLLKKYLLYSSHHASLWWNNDEENRQAPQFRVEYTERFISRGSPEKENQQAVNRWVEKNRER